ncbi:hypothetical protein C8A05DRAFT_42598 [Staphylotrichum tortipilum]|uniref:Uncharacterized protein n=1 Tax=Staphylotrichum tortipilum TaxID=2831512 RepID=A0AAN6MQ04_9PEZI|nr:hypothetical protein C8A05DRAFT_42598 [Staphylotrichum longicolle]
MPLQEFEQSLAPRPGGEGGTNGGPSFSPTPSPGSSPSSLEAPSSWGWRSPSSSRGSRAAGGSGAATRRCSSARTGAAGPGRPGGASFSRCSRGGFGGLFGIAAGGDSGRRGRSVSMPLIPRACSKGHFHFGVGGGGEGCRWPGEEGKGSGVERRKESWIDEDALHGPRVKAVAQPLRGRGPLRNRTPTLPRLHHTIHEYPYTMGASVTGMAYAQLRAFSSSALPEPPKPALVANRDKRIIRPSVTMGYVYGASRIPQPVLSPPPSPTRPSPMTPTRPRGRQRSTNSTLSDILRSIEKRLREGSVSETIRIRRLLGPREMVAAGSRSRTPSTQKPLSGEPFTPGHARQESQQSASLEADSLVGQELSARDVPLGLTSPSRAQKKPEAEQPLLKEPSARTSLSSELSTLYSEDEMPEEVKRAIMPFEGLVVQPQRAANVRRPSMNDPFVVAPLMLSAPRAASTGAWPTKHMQQSQRLRSMRVGEGRPQSQGLILAPGPVVHTANRSNLQPVIPPPSRRVSATILQSIQSYIASRASEPPPEPNPKPSAPIKLSQTTANHPPAPHLLLPSTERSSAPSSPTRRAVGGELRLSLGLPPRYLTYVSPHRASASSSVYSQHDPSPTEGARELNRAGFQANSSLYPAPLSRDQAHEGREQDDMPLAVTSTIASMRRMNSGVSTASSLHSIADRGVTPSPSPSVSPQRALVSEEHVDLGKELFYCGRGCNAETVEEGSGSGGGSPHKRRLQGSVHRQQRASAALLRTSGEEGKENHDSGFKVVAGEFTFEVSNPHVSGSGKGGVRLRESSSGSLNTIVPSPVKDAQRLSLAWKPTEGNGGGLSRTGSPVRAGGASPSRMSLRSMDSLGMYDRQGFLIAGSPVRAGTPSGVGV